MKIPADIQAPRPGISRLMGRMAENAVFWTVLVLLSISAVTSFYFDEQITVTAPLDQSHEGVSGSLHSMATQNPAAVRNPGKTSQRILRYQLRNGQLTIYP